MAERLDQISTHLSQMGVPDYLLRYLPAIRPYLKCILKDPELVEEVLNELVATLLEGGGMPWFRYYLTVLVRRAADRTRKDWERKGRRLADIDFHSLGDPSASDRGIKAAMLELTRVSLRQWTMEDLRRYQEEQRKKGHANSDYDIVEIQTNNPEADKSDKEIAVLLAARLGHTIAPGDDERKWHNAVRKRIGQARRTYAELLLANVKRGMDKPTAKDVEAELRALGMWEFVRDFLPDSWDAD